MRGSKGSCKQLPGGRDGRKVQHQITHNRNYRAFFEATMNAKKLEKATLIKDAIMTAAVIAVIVGALCYAAGGV